LCQESGFIYSRYADDIIVSCQNRLKLEGIERTITGLLESKLGKEFQINQSKSKLTTAGRKVSILGITIFPSGQIGIDIELKRKVEYQLHFFIKDRSRLLDLFGHDMELGLQQLAGYISHINTADPSFLEKLRRKYGTTVVDSFLHRSAK
jgi:RNA-directed DNA polymerase